jgi:hypothetical protein
MFYRSIRIHQPVALNGPRHTFFISLRRDGYNHAHGDYVDEFRKREPSHSCSLPYYPYVADLMPVFNLDRSFDSIKQVAANEQVFAKAGE